METQYIIYYPESHEHLHLFNDLVGFKDIELCCVKLKKISNKAVKKFRKLHLSHTLNKIIPLPLRKKWFVYSTINLDEDKNYKIIVMDGALRGLNSRYVKTLTKKNNVEIALVLINSMDAKSNSMVEVKPQIKKYNWNAIWTFDPRDADIYKFNYLGTCYYSKQELVNNDIKKYDAYFIGGIKGDRTDDILQLYSKLHKKSKIKFQVMLTGKDRFLIYPYNKEIEYFKGGWLSYEESLNNVANSNCIIEILQKGQSGPSLRYYEAVCYNKKLLTNNKNIIKLPFYNPKYMKIIEDYDNLDIDWIKKYEDINYGYQNEFSPIHMIKKVFEKAKGDFE